MTLTKIIYNFKTNQIIASNVVYAGFAFHSFWFSEGFSIILLLIVLVIQLDVKK